MELPEEEANEEMTSDFCHDGTWDASANFQEEVRKVLTRAGFKRGTYNPSAYYHEKVGKKAVGGQHASSRRRPRIRRTGDRF